MSAGIVRPGQLLRRIAGGLLCVSLLCLPAYAHEAHKHADGNSRPAAAPTSAGKLSIPDVAVLDQDGRTLRFYRDLVKGKVVAINSIYTTCTTLCPSAGAVFSRVQSLMGDRVGREVHLISISVDPATDTPERLKAWAAKFRAKPGWTLVTGKKRRIDTLLKALGAFSAAKEEHPPILLVVNDAAGVWTRASGLTPPDKLAELLGDMFANGRAESGIRKVGTR